MMIASVASPVAAIPQHRDSPLQPAPQKQTTKPPKAPKRKKTSMKKSSQQQQQQQQKSVASPSTTNDDMTTQPGGRHHQQPPQSPVKLCVLPCSFRDFPPSPNQRSPDTCPRSPVKMRGGGDNGGRQDRTTALQHLKKMMTMTTEGSSGDGSTDDCHDASISNLPLLFEKDYDDDRHQGGSGNEQHRLQLGQSGEHGDDSATHNNNNGSVINSCSNHQHSDGKLILHLSMPSLADYSFDGNTSGATSTSLGYEDDLEDDEQEEEAAAEVAEQVSSAADEDYFFYEDQDGSNLGGN